MKNTFTLHSYRRCPFAMRARMTLHEKNIPFDVIEENLRAKSEQLKRLHPRPSVPLLIHGERVIYESAIITEYLEMIQPEPRLMPDSPAQITEVRLWTAWCDQVFKPDIDVYKYGPVRLSEAEVNEGKQRLKNHLKKIDDCLKESEWLVGGRLSLADIHVFPFFRQLVRVNPPFPGIENFTCANAWLNKITSRPSFEATMKKIPA